VHDLFRAAEIERLAPLLDFLGRHPKVRVIGPTDPQVRAPTVAFKVEGRSSQDLAAQLAQEGIGVGAGNFYAYRLVQALGFDVDDGLVRTSFVHYTTAAEVDRLIATLGRLIG